MRSPSKLKSFMPNRLASETSPYLLQHKDNPVDWFPWGDEAFAKARDENKPVFLSVGYSSCHWCHVMEHESFENHEVAGVLNKHFVSIKVDREERPDIDEAYMAAVQASSGRGGWPMSVFLTADKKPFFAGTYFPKEERSGSPSFRTVLSQIVSAWTTRRADLEKAADEFARVLTEALGKPFPASEKQIDQAMIDGAVKAFASNFDPENGGSAGAPKFPPHTGLEFLMRYALQPGTPEDAREISVGMSMLTLERMCMGGIRDHVGGGFHRYSTDEHWVLPHFEKMLYDNALMLSNLKRGMLLASQLEEQLYMLFYMAAGGLVTWLVEEMRSPDGLFYSAVDADSEGVEGKFYTWNETEIRDVLGPRAQAFLKAYNFKPEGNFHDEATHKTTGENIPFLTEEMGFEQAEDLEKLAERRASRVRPGLDDKAIVGWNGLIISALTGPLGEACASRIFAAEEQLGYLPHQITKGVASGRGFLDDYAYFAFGLLSLAEAQEAEGEHAEEGVASRPLQPDLWRAEGERIVREMIELFYDEKEGGFFYTSDRHEDLFGRTKQGFDQPMPSANAIAIRCLLAVGDVERAKKSLQAFSGWMEHAPTATEALYTTALDLMLVEASLAENAAAPLEAVPEVPGQPEAPVAPKPKKEVAVRLEKRELAADSSGLASGKIVIEVPEGLHINSNDPPARWLTPTKLEVRPISGVAQYPPANDDRYEGVVEIPFTVQIPNNESGADFELVVSYQACTDLECLLPQEKTLNCVAYK